MYVGSYGRNKISRNFMVCFCKKLIRDSQTQITKKHWIMEPGNVHRERCDIKVKFIC